MLALGQARMHLYAQLACVCQVSGKAEPSTQRVCVCALLPRCLVWAMDAHSSAWRVHVQCCLHISTPACTCLHYRCVLCARSFLPLVIHALPCTRHGIEWCEVHSQPYHCPRTKVPTPGHQNQTHFFLELLTLVQDCKLQILYN